MDDIHVRESSKEILVVDVERHNQMSNLGSTADAPLDRPRLKVISFIRVDPVSPPSTKPGKQARTWQTNKGKTKRGTVDKGRYRADTNGDERSGIGSMVASGS